MYNQEFIVIILWIGTMILFFVYATRIFVVWVANISRREIESYFAWFYQISSSISYVVAVLTDLSE